mmetsp:Transcript_45899/g.90423  ORF Transcript_45899/g.90423 Transcript_45899/m.90423 type:complete len:215 (-) Transcript_45899:201-845(-)
MQKRAMNRMFAMSVNSVTSSGCLHQCIAIVAALRMMAVITVTSNSLVVTNCIRMYRQRLSGMSSKTRGFVFNKVFWVCTHWSCLGERNDVPDISSLMSLNLSITVPTKRLRTKKVITKMKQTKKRDNRGLALYFAPFPGSCASTQRNIRSGHPSSVATSKRANIALAVLSNDSPGICSHLRLSVTTSSTPPTHSVLLNSPTHSGWSNTDGSEHR